MWRDPLDELVEDLERLAPPSKPTWDWSRQFLLLQRWTDVILYGTADEVKILNADPSYQQLFKQSSAARERSE